MLLALLPAMLLPADAAAAPMVHSPTKLTRVAQFRAKPPGKRYSVTVPIGKLKPAIPLPPVAGPADAALPLVVLDAGHGGHDPGAINPQNGKREKDVTLAIARAIRDDLVASGRVRVALTRSDDQFLVLEERYGIARRLKADLFISVHADAAENPDAHGASIYTLSEVASDREAARLAARENKSNILNGVDLGAQSNDISSILIDLTQRETMNSASDFARLLQREASESVVFRTDAHRFASFVVLKSPDTPSVLFETGFISNLRDAEFLASPDGQRKIARGVSAAIQAHFARQRAAR
jgi:N-acetylmuramoyl-L-alanine amidase